MKSLAQTLADCCGSDAWVRAVVDAVGADPDPAEILRAADMAWSVLDDDEWRSAFAAHAATVPDATDAPTGDAARVAIRLYREQFGHAFVSSAAIASADELLMRVRIRLGNDAAAEWRQACEEQKRATRRRLEPALRRPG